MVLSTAAAATSVAATAARVATRVAAAIRVAAAVQPAVQTTEQTAVTTAAAAIFAAARFAAAGRLGSAARGFLSAAGRLSGAARLAARLSAAAAVVVMEQPAEQATATTAARVFAARGLAATGGLGRTARDFFSTTRRFTTSATMTEQSERRSAGRQRSESGNHQGCQYKTKFHGEAPYRLGERVGPTALSLRTDARQPGDRRETRLLTPKLRLLSSIAAARLNSSP
jgi:hypothetical protein